MKRLHTQSQNFLRSPTLVKKLIGHSNIKKSDTVYDIGAGSGIIASVLAGACDQVIAIEYDSRTAVILQKNMSSCDNVSVINTDFLTMDTPSEPYKVFSNIPFHLSSPIIRKLTEASHPPDAIYLIVQKQFAQKLLIGTDAFTGLLGAMITPVFTARIRYKLQRTDFSPSPAVDTVFIELLRRDTPLVKPDKMNEYRDFVEHCFSRQKYFQTLNVNKRPSELSSEEWVALYNKNS